MAGGNNDHYYDWNDGKGVKYDNTSPTLQVVPKSHNEDSASAAETKVEVNILNSPPLVLSVPGELELEDPAFIQFVAQEALVKYKEMVR